MVLTSIKKNPVKKICKSCKKNLVLSHFKNTKTNQIEDICIGCKIDQKIKGETKK